MTIGHFRISLNLCLKARLGAQPFIWKWIKLLFIFKIKNETPFHMVVHQASLWWRGMGELGNGLLKVGVTIWSCCRVPQGSGLGPLLFLIYINELPTTIASNCFLFADDCFLLEKVEPPGDCASKLSHELRSISDWGKLWLVTINETKTKAIVLSAIRDKPVHPPLILNNNIIEYVAVREHLGLTLSSNLSWWAHILKIHQKASKNWTSLYVSHWNIIWTVIHSKSYSNHWYAHP